MEKWLSLWSIGQQGELADFKRIKEVGFDGVEIWAEHIRANDYLNYAKECELRIGIHLPFHDLNLAAPDDVVKERMLSINKEWIQKIAGAGGEHAVIHGGLAWSSEERGEALTRVKDRLRDLNEVARANNVDLLLENLIPDKLNYTHVVASNVEEWINLVRETNVKACLDTGHLAVMNESLKETITRLNKLLGSIHYSDNDGQSDLHLIPVEGENVAADLFDSLKEIDYQGPVIYELNPYKYSLNEILCDFAKSKHHSS